MSACQKSEFEKTTHTRSENYGAIFDMMSKTEGQLTVNIEDKLWNEDQADVYFETVQNDYDTVFAEFMSEAEEKYSLSHS